VALSLSGSLSDRWLLSVFGVEVGLLVGWLDKTLPQLKTQDKYSL
jgi:hypothetical protein